MASMLPLLLTPFFLYSCECQDNFRQSFWDIELVRNEWWRVGCIMNSSPPDGKFFLSLKDNNDNVLLGSTRFELQTTVADYKAINSQSSVNGSSNGEALPDGNYLYQIEFNLNGTHFIATASTELMVSIRTNVQAEDVWQVELVGKGVVTCLPKVECLR